MSIAVALRSSTTLESGRSSLLAIALMRLSGQAQRRHGPSIYGRPLCDLR